MAGPGDALFPNPIGEQAAIDFPAAEAPKQAEVVSPLYLPQDSTSIGSFQVRDKPQKLVEDDLLGP